MPVNRSGITSNEKAAKKFRTELLRFLERTPLLYPSETDGKFEVVRLRLGDLGGWVKLKQPVPKQDRNETPWRLLIEVAESCDNEATGLPWELLACSFMGHPSVVYKVPAEQPSTFNLYLLRQFNYYDGQPFWVGLKTITVET